MTFTTKELRRFAELGGWKCEPFDLPITGVSSAPMFRLFQPNGRCIRILKTEALIWEKGLPDFSSDLAACFEVLERFCGERFNFDLASYNGEYGVTLLAKGERVFLDDVSCDSGSKTIQEAIIKAVLKAATLPDTSPSSRLPSPDSQDSTRR